MERTSVALGALAWILAVQFFVAQVFVAAAWTEPYDLGTRVISDLGNTECGPYPRGSGVIVCSPRHALMNLSFMIVGVTMAAGAILARNAFRPGWIRSIAVLLFVAAGIGVLMVGVYPENEHGTNHTIGAAINFVGGNVALILFGLAAFSGASRTRFHWFGIFSVLAGVAGLAATVLFVMHRDLGLGAGGMERVAAYSTSSWQIVAGLVLWRGNIRRGPMKTLAALVILLTCASPAHAEVKRIVIDVKTSPAFGGRTFGDAGQYETLAGRAFGELDPNDPHNRIITDIQLAPRNSAGLVEYVASFFIVKPIDLSKSSRLLWHDVPNRGGRITIPEAERALGDIGLSSGWQGDNAGNTVPGPNNDYAIVPVARNADGSPIAGLVMGRIVNASGLDSQQIDVNSNPLPYKPASLDTTKATLTTHAFESIEGGVIGISTVPAGDWAWARCSASEPFPGTPDPTQICVKGGFDPKLLYQVVFTAQDPYVLGIGFAAFRDVASFFKNADEDSTGTPNPLAGGVSWIISRGRSQSGNFLRAFLQLGFNEDEQNRKVHDGAWPIIAGRRVTLNARFALPDGALKLYEAGSEGPQWWAKANDPVRGLPPAGILDRCSANNTCPRIIEHFGAAEMWALHLSPAFVGTSADIDLPLPENVRRYYVPSTQHGGGSGGFSTVPAAAPSCPGTNFGTGMFAANPVPHTETFNAIRYHFRNWVMRDVAPPPSKYPTLADGTLVNPSRGAMGFPAIPGVPPGAPTGLVNPMLDYDWGPGFNYVDGSGVPTNMPPGIKRVIRMKVPRVDADGNELGGVPVVLRDAPLGTYLGWNIVAAGFHRGKLCNYAGGMIPFARTRAERLTRGDPRLSLEERYQTHEGYVTAVKAAAARAVSESFLLQEDADRLIAQAEASNVLKPD